MMLLPHNREFPYRRQFFFGVTGISVFLAGVTSGLNQTSMLVNIGIAAVVAVVMYFYCAWIIGFELRFIQAHPRKIRFTSVLSFYLPVAVSALLLAGSPCALQQPWLDAPEARCMYFLAIPVLLAAVAGSYRSIALEPGISFRVWS